MCIRDRILAVHAKNKPLAEDVDLEKLAKGTSGSVSYTHLDVYKRQVHRRHPELSGPADGGDPHQRQRHGICPDRPGKGATALAFSPCEYLTSGSLVKRPIKITLFMFRTSAFFSSLLYL